MKAFRLLVFFLFISGSSLFAQIKLSDTLKVDPKVTIGKLDNGLTYYIRQNEKPQGKVELRLVINAGSILENDNQQGIAHLSEHMAFNGTKNFKKNELISFLQSIGVKFGNDLNAYTGFDQTVYILPIPTDKPSNIEKGFQILEDWAHNVTYNNEDIDNERPIILEESRMGKGADDRIYRKIYPQLFNGSLYADRLPIGIDSIVENASYNVVKQFYKDWYRPNLMAVIVVGDINPDKAESLIKEHFGDIKNPKNERERITPSVAPYKESSALVITDPEATSYSYLISYSAKKKAPIETIGDYKEELVKSIFSYLLNQRLRELTQQENPPFLGAQSSFSSIARGYESFLTQIITGSKSDLTGLKAFQKELERVKLYGFLETELERAKVSMLNSINRAYKERDKTPSGNYASEYINNFLSHEPIPGVGAELDYYKKLLPQITLDDVNAIAKQLEKNQHAFIALMGPEPSSSVTLPTEEEILAVEHLIDKAALKPYEEKEIATSLISEPIKAGKIISTSKNTVLGTTELTLSNGVKVTLKNTNFKNDQILMSAVRDGGKGNYGLEDRYNAQYMIPVISSMGIGNFSPTVLKKMLTGKTVDVNPTFSETSDGMSGSSSVKDLESMMQLIHLYFTSPRKDTGLFHSFIQKNKAQLAFLSANPQVVFIDSVYNTLYHHSPLAPIVIPKPAYFDQLNLDRIMQMYKERFGVANEMHFTFVGSIPKDEIKPLLEKYIASLPTSNKPYEYVDNKLRPIKGKVAVNVNEGKAQKALIISIYTGEIPYSEDLDLKINAISEILNITIIEELREKIKGIYGGGTKTQLEKIPYSHYTFLLQLPTGPDKVDTILSAARGQIQDLIKNGPTKENLDKVKQQWIEAYKVGVKENGTWLSQLKDIQYLGKSPDYFINYEKHVNALTTKGIHEAAKLLLTTDNVLTGILRPEKVEK